MATVQKKNRKRTKPNIGFQLDEELNALITNEFRKAPWRSKSMVIRERLRQSYADYPLPNSTSN